MNRNNAIFSVTSWLRKTAVPGIQITKDGEQMTEANKVANANLYNRRETTRWNLTSAFCLLPLMPPGKLYGMAQSALGEAVKSDGA